MLICLCIIKGTALGQICTTAKVRVYATAEEESNISGILTSIQDTALAANSNPSDYSTFNTGIAGSVTQFLKFSQTYHTGTPVTVKLSLPTGLLSLLSAVVGGVTIQPFKNLNYYNGPLGVGSQWQATAVGPATKLGDIVGLLNGAGDKEVTINPTGDYDGVWVNLSGLNVGQNIKLFGAYIEKDAPSGSVMGCSTPVDVMAGVRAGTVIGGIANATGSVDHMYNAIDNDLNTAAELKLGAKILSEVYHTTIFNVESQPGDYVRMLIGDSDGGLLKLASLSTLNIQLYDGTTPVGPLIDKTSNLLSLSLFSGTDETKQYLNIKPPDGVTFDRVEVQIGGLANVDLFATGLKIYDVKRVIPAPVSNIDGALSTSKLICGGTTSTLSVSNPSACTIYKWYDASTGGHLLQTDTAYTPPVSNPGVTTTTQYYVEASHAGCSEASERTPVSLTVNPPPTVVATMNPAICGGVTSTSWAYTSTNAPQTYSIVWDPAAITAGFVNVTNAILPVSSIPVTIPANAPTGTYTGTLYVKNASGCLNAGQPISVNVDALPTQPVINLTP